MEKTENRDACVLSPNLKINLIDLKKQKDNLMQAVSANADLDANTSVKYEKAVFSCFSISFKDQLQ